MNNISPQIIANEVCDWFLNTPKTSLGDVERKLFDYGCDKVGNPIYTTFDILFYTDDQGCSLAYYLVLEDEHKFFKDLTVKYGYKLKEVEPANWGFIFYEDERTIHNQFKKFFGKKYYESIFSENNKDVTYLSPAHFQDFYNKGKLEKFFNNIENIKNIRSNHHLNAKNIWSVFLSNNPEGVKEYIKKDLESKQPSIDYSVFEGKPVTKPGEKAKDIYLNLPNQQEIKFILDNFSLEKGSEIIKSFIEINEIIYEKKYPEKTVDTSEKDFLYLMSIGFDLKGKTKDLIKYIDGKQELILYCLMTEKIPLQDFTQLIKNPGLKAEANYNILKNELDTSKNNTQPKLKI